MKSIAKFGNVGMFLGVAAAFVTTLSSVQPAQAHDSRDFRRDARIEARVEAHRDAMAARQYAFAQNQFSCAPVGYQINRPSLVSNVLWHLGL
jgi:hypothetical protein